MQSSFNSTESIHSPDEKLGFLHRVKFDLKGKSSHLFLFHHCIGSSPVRYAKFLSILYFIDIDIFRNLLINIDIDIFQNLIIDSDIDIDIFQNLHFNIDILKKTLSIFCRHQYFQKRCRYFIDIAKNADISTIDIDIS